MGVQVENNSFRFVLEKSQVPLWFNMDVNIEKPKGEISEELLRTY